jgi:hypothetical protein
MIRHALWGLSLTLFLGCGETINGMGRCSPSTCHGCCDLQGVCEPGTADLACGTGGAACQTCQSPQTCSATGQCGSSTAMLPAGAKLVFTTRGEYSANFYANDPDTNCRAAATAAGLTGTFVSWVSWTEAPATTHAAIDRVTSNGPYYLTCPGAAGYVKAFNNLSQLQGAPLVLLDCDEFGTKLTSTNITTALVWTGTVSGGAKGATCNATKTFGHDWDSSSSNDLGTAGSFNGALTAWTDSGDVSCSATGHLYCIQQ